MGSFTVNLSEEDMAAVKRAMTEKAEAARAAKQAEMERAAAPTPARSCGRCGAPQDGGRFCTACGAALTA